MLPLVFVLSWVQANRPFYKKLEGYPIILYPQPPKITRQDLPALYMLIVRYIRILIFGLLAAFVPHADAKKGGRSKSTGKTSKTVVYGDGGSTYVECIDQET